MSPRPSAVGVSDQVPDGPFKVFIGGLPYHMSEADIQTMLTAAGGGPLRALRVVKDQTPQPVRTARERKKARDWHRRSGSEPILAVDAFS